LERSPIWNFLSLARNVVRSEGTYCNWDLSCCCWPYSNMGIFQGLRKWLNPKDNPLFLKKESQKNSDSVRELVLWCF
jgi:hypothetical protein